MSAGAHAEQLFRELTGAGIPEKSTSGDAMFQYNGAYRYVEVKECNTGSINQVRAMKFIPLAILDPDNRWIVIPGRDLVDMACRKARGMHTEIPFESMGLTLASLKLFVIRGELRHAVLDAFDLDDKALALSGLMAGLHHELRAVTHRYCMDAKRIIARDGGLMPRITEG